MKRGRQFFRKQIIKSGKFLIRGSSIWRDRPSTRTENIPPSFSKMSLGVVTGQKENLIRESELVRMSGRDGTGWSGGYRCGTPPHFAHTNNRPTENVEITIRRAPAASSRSINHKVFASFPLASLPTVPECVTIIGIGTEAAKFGPAVWPRTLAHTNNSRSRQHHAPNLTSDSARIKELKD